MEIKRSGTQPSQKGPPEQFTGIITTTHRRGDAPSRRAMLLGLGAAPVAACASRLGAGTGATPAAVSSAKSPGAFAGNGPFPAQGMAAYSASGPLKPMVFRRRALGPKDVAIQLHYCGVCHSDIHTIHGDWGAVQYPQIVGHELAGEVVAVGSSVSKFRVGARVGVGTMVDSCRHCAECEAGHENYCLNGNTQTYGSKDRDGSITQGGYSTFVVVDEDFVIRIPDAIDLAAAGPLLCAGSPSIPLFADGGSPPASESRSSEWAASGTWR